MHRLQLAVRSLRRAPGFTLTAAATLALGIGLSTAVFTVADALLIRRMPVVDQDRIIAMWGETPDKSSTNFPLSIEEFREFTRTAQSLESAAFFAYEGAWPQPVRFDGNAARARRSLVSGNFFDVLGARPVLGRTLRPEDDVAGAAPVAVISYQMWRAQFGRDSAVLSKSIVVHLTGRSHAIVGVMPQGIDYPRGTEFWVPLVASSTGTADSLHLRSPALDIVGRLRRGASVDDARTELTAFFHRPDGSTWSKDVNGVAGTLPTIVLGDTRPALFVLSAAAALLLLVTCINVANLLLVRGLARVREIAVRMALGAARGRVVGELLTESALIAFIGATLGTGLAVAAVQAFTAFAPPSIPRLDEIGVSITTLAIAVGITALATMLFALAPAVITSRADLQHVLRSGARQGGRGRGYRVATESLVVGQVALAVVVLAFAGLITKSLVNLQRIDLAFDTKPVIVAEWALRNDGSVNRAAQKDLVERVVARVQALPQVDAVTPALAVPFSAAGGITARLGRPDQPRERLAENPMLAIEVIAPNYFRALGIPITRGRAFTDDDATGSPPVIMVGASTARHFWPNSDPVGKTLGVGQELQFTVVGVVPDTRYRELRSARPAVYIPLKQSFFPVAPLTLLIKTSGPASALIPALRQAIAEVDSRATLASAVPFATLLDVPRAQPRLNALLLAVFAITAIALAAIGLFGVIARMVRQRARELGIRMALGATSASVQRMVMMRGLALAGVGSALGIAGALVTSRFLSALLFEVTPTDIATLVTVAGAMLGIAALASYVPMRASGRIEPAVVLQNE